MDRLIRLVLIFPVFIAITCIFSNNDEFFYIIIFIEREFVNIIKSQFIYDIIVSKLHAYVMRLWFNDKE